MTKLFAAMKYALPAMAIARIWILSYRVFILHLDEIRVREN